MKKAELILEMDPSLYPDGVLYALAFIDHENKIQIIDEWWDDEQFPHMLNYRRTVMDNIAKKMNARGDGVPVFVVPLTIAQFPNT